MSIEAYRREIEGVIGSRWGTSDLITEAQRLALNTAFPNDFEYYLLALEVIDSENIPMERFTFPVMPKMIRNQRPTIKTIEKTYGGVITNFATSFVPYPISVSGTFGKKLRFTLGLDTPQMLQYTYGDPKEVNAKKLFKKAATVNPRIRTGYGYTQKLKDIFAYGQALDKKGNPYKIVFYNMAANEVVYVEMDNLVTDINDQEKNMMWGYSLQMTAVAPVQKVSVKDTLKNMAGVGDGGASDTVAAIDNIA